MRQEKLADSSFATNAAKRGFTLETYERSRPDEKNYGINTR
jgi:hypothetical protein